jgi:hypothetical protein
MFLLWSKLGGQCCRFQTQLGVSVADFKSNLESVLPISNPTWSQCCRSQIQLGVSVADFKSNLGSVLQISNPTWGQCCRFQIQLGVSVADFKSNLGSVLPISNPTWGQCCRFQIGMQQLTGHMSHSPKRSLVSQFALARIHCEILVVLAEMQGVKLQHCNTRSYYSGMY